MAHKMGHNSTTNASFCTVQKVEALHWYCIKRSHSVQYLRVDCRRKRSRTEASRGLEELRGQTNWQSPEALKLFHPLEADKSVQAALKRWVHKLTTVIQYPEGYCNVIDGGDPSKACTEWDKHDIRERCRYLRAAYMIALENETQEHWGDWVEVRLWLYWL